MRAIPIVRSAKSGNGRRPAANTGANTRNPGTPAGVLSCCSDIVQRAARRNAERDKEYQLDVAMAGFQPCDVVVTATPRELVVHAKATETRDDQSKGQAGQLRWSGFRSNNVYRRVELPVDVVVDNVSATIENGLLKIPAQKAEQPSAVVAVQASQTAR